MRILILLAIVAAAYAADGAPAPTSSSDAEARRLIEAIVAAQRGLHTVQGTLRQSTHRLDEPQEPPQEYDVRFALAVPDRYDLVYTKPDDRGFRNRFVCDGRQVAQVEQIDEDTEPAVSVRPLTRDGDDVATYVLDLISIREADALRDFAAQPVTTVDGVRLTLRPLRGRLANEVRDIVVDLDRGYHTRAVHVEDTSGNRIDAVITDVRYDEPIPDARFAMPVTP